MTTLFQITVAYDEVNSRYAIGAYDCIRNEAMAKANSLNKVWKEVGDKIKAKEKERKNFPLPEKPPHANGAIIAPNGEIQLPPDRKIISLEP